MLGGEGRKPGAGAKEKEVRAVGGEAHRIKKYQESPP